MARTCLCGQLSAVIFAIFVPFRSVQCADSIWRYKINFLIVYIIYSRVPLILAIDVIVCQRMWINGCAWVADSLLNTGIYAIYLYPQQQPADPPSAKYYRHILGSKMLRAFHYNLCIIRPILNAGVCIAQLLKYTPLREFMVIIIFFVPCAEHLCIYPTSIL